MPNVSDRMGSFGSSIAATPDAAIVTATLGEVAPACWIERVPLTITALVGNGS